MTDTQHGTAARAPRLTVECAGCGVPMKVGGAQRRVVEAGRPVYHSQDCRKQHTWVTQPCARCGQAVTRPRSEVAKLLTGRLFCSPECRNATGTKPKTGRDVPCGHCGKSVWVRPSADIPGVTRYCSPECSNEAQRAGRVEQTCQHCGKVDLVPPSKVSPYCSRECNGAARRRAPGETWVDDQGYVWEFVAEGGRRPQHRLRMEEVLGRPLLSEEEVHHLSGDRQDNRIDGPPRVVNGKLRSGNLELWSSRQPRGQEIPAKVAWAREILALYGELVPEE